MHINNMKAFTLVELAIVLTIIGLLVGGIIKGQELVTLARISATISQIQDYKAATLTFQDTYGAFPGDLRNASSRIPGCNAGCDTVVSGWGRPGDGSVGQVVWTGSPQIFATTTQGDTIAPDVGYETSNFWTHLLLAGLIGGVTDMGIRAAIPRAFGVTEPASPLGGGFVIGMSSGTSFYSNPPAGSVALTNGLMLALMNAPVSALVQLHPAYDPYTNIITPTQAMRIDEKIDDGRPGAGNVRAGGGEGAAGTAGCYITGQDAYNTSNNRITCKLLIALQAVP